MMLGGADDEDDDDFEDMQENDVVVDEGGCGNDQQRSPLYDLDLDEIDGQVEETRSLDIQSEPDKESRPKLEQGRDSRKPKLAINDDNARLAGGRDGIRKNRISGFQTRESRRSGSGQLLGGGSGGFAGFIG